ncbi:DNA-binding transcriptional regulator, MerR family [Dethiosulfatibacter aminovorans DSM 17477]|uniref:DNA-binding transcriptional regulator, MerR family n=1 Tax=Dethiosulfatibacter aminovorans DSM 17477 TaxID=1121476 RepID=A0A1M6MJY0_9FIRM|nr:MerR family transcriptional regulator [Dethiosulfatibacter aminovorans]SHJ83573.1 DNA-binding transcriptional regulator, MerR family [Dethiosulfatibacter aminovorans DSM 17477]
MKRKNLISITEFARLRGVTTETLRHYDRIGLLKPAYIDPKTGMRYYSLAFEDEKLGTIIELKQLDMSLGEINNFLHERSLNKSYVTLKKKQAELKAKIENMKLLYNVLDQRILKIEQAILHDYDFDRIYLKHINKRRIIISELGYTDEYDLNRAAIIIERKLDETAPILGGERFILVFPYENIIRDNIKNECRIGIVMGKDNNSIYENFRIESGLYVCTYRFGSPFDIKVSLQSIKEFCFKKKLRICGNLIAVLTVDMSVTDIPEENVYELQVPVIKQI